MRKISKYIGYNQKKQGREDVWWLLSAPLWIPSQNGTFWSTFWNPSTFFGLYLFGTRATQVACVKHALHVIEAYRRHFMFSVKARKLDGYEQIFPCSSKDQAAYWGSVHFPGSILLRSSHPSISIVRYCFMWGYLLCSLKCYVSTNKKQPIQWGIQHDCTDF